MADKLSPQLVIPTGGRSRDAWLALIESVELDVRLHADDEERVPDPERPSARERLIRALEESGACPPAPEQAAAQMQEVLARQRARWLVLDRVYQQAKGQAEAWVDLWGLGLSEIEESVVEAAAAYLTAAGLARRDQSRDWDTLALTGPGVDYVEARLLARSGG